MIKCLRHFNFGESLISWVKVFYKNISSVVINNGHISESFSIEQGVRQGCPLSSSLFIICIQILTNFIAKDKSIKGIVINNKEIKQTLFADDATYINNGDKKSFERLIEVITEFGKISGLKLNTSKSVVLKIGRLKSRNVQYARNMNFIWTSECAKTLGVTFYTNYKISNDKNLEPQIVKFKKCLKQWQHRKLTLMGKITVIKTFALPKLIYPFTILENPNDEVIKDINTCIFDFLWEGKRKKLKRSILKRSYELGGLKLTDIQTFLISIKACWVKRLLNDNNGQWKSFYDSYLKKAGGKLIFDGKLNNKDITNICDNHQFLKDVITSWYSIIHKDESELNTRKHSIWNNSDIKIQGKTLYWKKWNEKGIVYVDQIYDFRNRKFYSFQQMTQLYNLDYTDFLKYHQLTSCIPNHIKECISMQFLYENKESIIKKNLSKSKQPNQYLYKILIKTSTDEKPAGAIKWEEKLNRYDIEWKYYFQIPFKSTIDTKLQDFQYKLLMRLLPTNKYLFKCKLSSSNLCDFCSMNIETLEHIIWECNKTQIFWNEIGKYLTSKNVKINFTIINVSFGLNDKNNNETINFIIILAIFFIFKMKYNKTIPSFDKFLPFLQNRIRIEREIALIQDKLEKYENKWTSFL
jgi:hypothetical protein